MRQAFFFLFFTGILCTIRVSAQQKDSVLPKPITDSIRAKQVSDSLLAKQLSDSALEKEDNRYKGTKTSGNTDSLQEAQRKRYRKATLYSAILPGAGQVYNKKYWKVPIVYAALGIPAYYYFYNKTWYNNCQYALTVTINGSTGDSLEAVAPPLKPFVAADDVNGIITYRDQFRKYQDYSVLFFLLFYALNIVDATVDAHLKDFNVTNDLSFRVKPYIVPGPTPIAGITLAFDVHKPRYRGMGLN